MLPCIAERKFGQTTPAASHKLQICLLGYEKRSYVYIVIIPDYLTIRGRVQKSHGSISNGLHTVMNNHTLQMGVKLFLIKLNFQSNGNVNSERRSLEKTTNKIAFLFGRY
jgi:hypothetical protein